MEKSEDDIEEVEKGVYELFKYIFITNCKIDENSMTEEEAKTIEELDSLELLQNLKDLANELLDFKKEHKNSELSELAERADQFKSMKQKLQTEVRNHLNIQQQLNQHLEQSVQKVQELEQELKDYKIKAKELEEIQKQMPAQDNEIEIKMQGIQKKYQKQLQKTIQQYCEQDNISFQLLNIQSQDKRVIELQQLADQRAKSIQKLQQEYQILIEERQKRVDENDKLQREYESVIGKGERDWKLDSNLDFLRHRLQAKTVELNKLQEKQFLRKQNDKLTRNRSARTLKKKPGNSEFNRNYRIINSKKRYASRGHIRNSSENFNYV